MEQRVRLVLRHGKEKSVYRRHPWIFSGAVQRVEGKPEDGCLADVYSIDGQYLATGHYQQDNIILKVLRFDSPVIDTAFWRERIVQAVRYRQRLGLFDAPDTNVFRLVHGEGDGLPGLIADFYNGVLVLQAHSEGMHRTFPELLPLFHELLGGRLMAVYDKSSATLPSGNAEDGWLLGSVPDEREVEEYGNRFLISFPEAQKTGFFIDQRENRLLLQSLSQGRRVLNTFGYTGGFTLSALRGGASYVETVDISKKAIQQCNANVAMNFPHASHCGVAQDALQYLARLEKTFDIMVLDPPAFAKNHRSLQQGLKGYKNINQRALEKIAPGGLLFTFSCSQAVSRDDFQTMLFTAAANAHRDVRIVRRLSQGPDHPVSIYHPEGEYLKGLLVYVE
ncbi:MAG: class I SAM-dependent rRNA methyltransferase [Bacteroidales bacterium]|nr:class I SAM-dependent rRNA methyltransferase [Bacteroidales bacterium]